MSVAQPALSATPPERQWWYCLPIKVDSRVQRARFCYLRAVRWRQAGPSMGRSRFATFVSMGPSPSARAMSVGLMVRWLTRGAWPGARRRSRNERAARQPEPELAFAAERRYESNYRHQCTAMLNGLALLVRSGVAPSQPSSPSIRTRIGQLRRNENKLSNGRSAPHCKPSRGVPAHPLGASAAVKV